eukprot:scaffold197220_cov21-Tisochrysis_lutea.AAC.1
MKFIHAYRGVHQGGVTCHRACFGGLVFQSVPEAFWPHHLQNILSLFYDYRVTFLLHEEFWKSAQYVCQPSRVRKKGKGGNVKVETTPTCTL